jgi:HD superfamily phosphohydrolase
MSASRKPKLFRDPVHDTIALPQESRGDKLLIALLDTPEVQRLRRIRQLGLTSVVYPGAEHSRFQHSLGVLWTAHEMLSRLEKRTTIAPETRTLVLCGALLHDVGHGPMSHALETVTGIKHERWTEAIIGGRTLEGAPCETGVSEALAAYAPDLAGRLVTLYGKNALPADVPAFARDIVSSQLDADRLDYILRDGHATGVRIGSYDLARILALIDLTDVTTNGRTDTHLAIHIGAQEAVEGYLLARFHMYKQVYLHKTSRSAERMLEAMLKRARALKLAGEPLAYWPDGALGKLIAGDSLTPTEFATLDDADINFAMKRWASPDIPQDRWLTALAHGLVHRALWKPLALPADDTRADELVHAARAVARVNGFDPDVAVLTDSSRDSLYRPFTGATRQKSHDDSIRLIDSSGRVSYIEDRSDVVKMLSHLEVRQRLICVHPDLREPIARATRLGS